MLPLSFSLSVRMGDRVQATFLVWSAYATELSKYLSWHQILEAIRAYSTRLASSPIEPSCSWKEKTIKHKKILGEDPQPGGPRK